MKRQETNLQGYGKRLDVDLSTGKVVQGNIDPKFAREFVGGMGFSCKILYDEAGTDVDPFSSDNPVIIANGVLTGTNAPCAARTEVTTRSPLTGHLGTGNTGGSWGTALKRAGFDLIVVKGKSQKPVYLWIEDGKCELRDAGHLWGKDTEETSHILERELVPSAPTQVKVMAIGQAGENRVRFACEINEYHHGANRNGAGAVMGDKKLKAIAVRGIGVPSAARPEEFQEAVAKARERLKKREEEAKMWGATSGDLVKMALGMGALPGRNFQTGYIAGFEKVVETDFVRTHVARAEGTCHGCPMTCFYLGELTEGKYAGAKVARALHHPGPVWPFGANCGIDNLPAIWKCKSLCQQFGMDYPSSGAVIAFAMELFQRGIITRKDTDGLDLSWGNEDAVIQLLHKIAFREGFGDVLADGAAKAAERIGRGAEKYVMAIKGMEMMYFDPRTWRKGYLFGELTNPRGGDNLKGTHNGPEQYKDSKWSWWLDSFFDGFEDVKKKIYDVPAEDLSSTWEGKPMQTKWFEDLTSLHNALGICIFPGTSGLALGPIQLSELYAAFTGWDVTPQDAMKLGERIFTVLKAYTARHGLTRKDDTWPDRFYTEQLPEGPTKGAVLSREEMDRLLTEYYELRGWDTRTGLPTEAKLVELGLGDIARELSKLGKLPKG